VIGGRGVERDRHVAHALHQRPVADERGGLLEVDRLVMADLRLRARPSCGLSPGHTMGHGAHGSPTAMHVDMLTWAKPRVIHPAREEALVDP
ncbi:MAG TPA: hypothetical protein VLL28_05370, partial [Hyphomicrobiaceae bacterium]|nr:hypothetical protein [Hyphomicrobiaceae bacterium]